MARSGDRPIVIIGAGLVGAACGLALARGGRSVTVIDVRPPEKQQGALGIDIRNVALNPQSRQLLERLGVWPDDVAAYTDMHVWEEFGQARLEFSAADVGVDALGWLVEASPLQVTLWEALKRRCEVIVGSVSRIERGDGGFTLHGIERPVTADLVIAADGGRSRVAELLGYESEREPVHQTALATVLRSERAHGGVARQRFLVDGPLALLPGPDPNLVSVVWSQSDEAAERRMALADRDFIADIERASERVLGRIEAVDRRMTFPLVQQWRGPSLKALPGGGADRLLFIGDAQRIVHPLAGLGANLGFEDVAALAACLERGELTPRRMSEYVRARHARSVEVIRLLGLLKRAYGWRGPWVTLARNLGVDALNRTGMIKSQLMREAMGLGPLSQAR